MPFGIGKLVILIPLCLMFTSIAILVYSKWLITSAAKAAADTAAWYHDPAHAQKPATEAAQAVLARGLLPSGSLAVNVKQCKLGEQKAWSATVTNPIIPAIAGIPSEISSAQDTSVALEAPVLMAVNAQFDQTPKNLWIPIVPPPATLRQETSQFANSYVLMSRSRDSSYICPSGACNTPSGPVPNGCNTPAQGFATRNEIPVQPDDL